MQTKMDICASSVDPDKTAGYESSPLYLHCLLFCFWFLTKNPIFINGLVQIKGRKNPLQKLKGEQVKIKTTARTVITCRQVDGEIIITYESNISYIFSHA